VVIRDTKYHDPLEGEVDMSPLDVLQMLGRAGRPGYDDVGYGWVVCDRSDADRYRKLLREGKEIESQLAEDLPAHLNAEIAMGTITDLDDVMSWLETTFYYVRAQSEPERYDFQGLRDRVRTILESLVERGFVEAKDMEIEATPLGRLASKYYLQLETAEQFHDLAGRDRLDVGALLSTVAGAAEFDSVSARAAEEDAIESVLAGDDAGLEGGNRKVLAILQAAIAGSTPTDLRSDAWVIRQNALRLLAALGEFLDRFAGPRAANLAQRIEARVEHGVSRDAVGLTAIDGVGAGRASALASAGFRTPRDLVAAGAEELARAGVSESVAERLIENAEALPAIDVDWGAFPETIARGDNRMVEVGIHNVCGGARVGIRVTVNDVEMTSKTTYLSDQTTVPVAVFGTDEELEFTIEVAFPDLPLLPVAESRTVMVE
jgi:replicative superfamily II helicase